MRDRELRGFRLRNGAASFVRRLTRRREKNRKRSRWRRRIRDRETGSLKLGDLRIGVLTFLRTIQRRIREGYRPSYDAVLRFDNTRLVTKSHNDNPAWLPTNTRSEARTAAAL